MRPCVVFLQHIETWLSSGRDHERERAITVTAHILAYFLDNLNVKVRDPPSLSIQTLKSAW